MGSAEVTSGQGVRGGSGRRPSVNPGFRLGCLDPFSSTQETGEEEGVHFTLVMTGDLSVGTWVPVDAHWDHPLLHYLLTCHALDDEEVHAHRSGQDRESEGDTVYGT